MTELNKEEKEIPLIKYEYLDHTADVQLHAWGDSLEEAFVQCVQAMFGYMTEIDKVEILEKHEIEAQGEDLLSLLFHLLDEFLFLFSAEPFFIPRKVKITEFDRVNFKIVATGYGEIFDLKKHPQGTEWQAIISRKSASIVTKFVHPASVSGEAFSVENELENPSDRTGLPECVQKFPKSDLYSGTRTESNEVALEAKIAQLMEANEIVVLANQQLANTVENMELKFTEACNTLDELAKQNIDLQDELLKKNRDLQKAEQQVKDVIAAKHQSSSTVDMMQIEIRALKEGRSRFEECISHLKTELAEKDSQHKSEQANEQMRIERLMAKHATELNEMTSANNAFAQRVYDQYKIDMEDKHLQYEFAIADLRHQLDWEHQARLHLALEEVREEYDYNHRETVRMLQDQVENMRDVANADRNKAEQLAQSLTACKAKLLDMETTNHHLEEALLQQKQMTETNFYELIDTQHTIGKMRSFHASMLTNRDTLIAGLQEKVEELEKACHKDIGQVTPDYYKILGIERNASPSDLRTAYRAKALLHHPDKHRDATDQIDHESIFKTLNDNDKHHEDVR
uniref:EOG090X0IKX n=1 Tax=Daphnia hispanica TaxID=575233 RepID=A0A4Y7M6H8_9CRUS|nr:EOG090X0IKX [Daphnia hispanica]